MIYNCHIHTFLEKDIPRRYLPLGLVRILSTTPGFQTIGFLLNVLNPITSNDQLKRYKKIVEIGRYKSQKEIFEECRKFYPENSRFVVVSMDMEYMNAGKVPRKYKDQLKELAELQKMYPEIVLPFVHLDPRRPGMMDILKQCMEEWDFKGIKIYPSVGYFPYDARLKPVYQYAEKFDVPIISHCSPYNPTYNRSWPYEIKAMLSDSKIPLDRDTCNRKRLCSNFANPLNFPFVMDEFKKLRICLAHFGSEYYWDQFLDHPEDKDSWFTIIKDMMAKYKNLYSDVSYTLNNQQYFPLLKVLMSDPEINSQILFGSDYYMVENKATERRFSIDLRGYLGEDIFRKIAFENPKKFLGIN
ncbi:MAG TPA: amidohydrolase family protein [Bacteroidales bacterium]|nr:amidohydrolase family protein [Bacteroidales bacterium]